MKDLFKASRLITEEQSQEISSLRRQIDDRERSCKQMETEFQECAQGIASEKDRQS